MRTRWTAPAAALAMALSAPAVRAWNETGHRAVAAIAYDRLLPEVRAKVDALLKAHPDYQKLAGGAADPAREAFQAAAFWPDTIRNDPRFYDDTKPNAAPTPMLPGFPDMKQHTNWHYVDFPFSPDGTPTEPPEEPNALMELRRMLGKELEPYDIPWLLHLVGDVHQPLHATQRFLKAQVDKNGRAIGDAGGNGVHLKGGMNLHWYWDILAGTTKTEEFLRQLVAGLVKAYPAEDPPKTDPKVWIDESFELAGKVVYSFGDVAAPKENPIALSDEYAVEARKTARERVALAGYRLAAVLNQKLK